MNRRNALAAIGLSSLAGTLLASCGKESGSKTEQSGASDEMVPEPPADDGMVELLFVQEAGGVRFADGKLRLTDLNPQTLYFADRPDDAAGFLTYKEYVDLVFASVKLLLGEPPAEGVRAVLFIDTVGRPMSPTSVAGVHRRHRRRRRRRAVH